MCSAPCRLRFGVYFSFEIIRKVLACTKYWSGACVLCTHVLWKVICCFLCSLLDTTMPLCVRRSLLFPDPPIQKRKGSSQKDRTTMSPHWKLYEANQITEAESMTIRMQLCVSCICWPIHTVRRGGTNGSRARTKMLSRQFYPHWLCIVKSPSF